MLKAKRELFAELRKPKDYVIYTYKENCIAPDEDFEFVWRKNWMGKGKNPVNDCETCLVTRLDWRQAGRTRHKTRAVMKAKKLAETGLYKKVEIRKKREGYLSQMPEDISFRVFEPSTSKTKHKKQYFTFKLLTLKILTLGAACIFTCFLVALFLH